MHTPEESITTETTAFAEETSFGSAGVFTHAKENPYAVIDAFVLLTCTLHFLPLGWCSL
jgi:hypothetical protein